MADVDGGGPDGRLGRGAGVTGGPGGQLKRSLENSAAGTVDEFHGGDRSLRRDLQARGMGYVLAVARNHHVTTSPALGPHRADHIAAALSSRAWWMPRLARRSSIRRWLRNPKEQQGEPCNPDPHGKKATCDAYDGLATVAGKAPFGLVLT